MEKRFDSFERIGQNLYRSGGKYYRLFGRGITPNGCWIIAPELIELIDIDTATGIDVYGKEVFTWDVTGSITADIDFILK